jgi:hypothetical protein
MKEQDVAIEAQWSTRIGVGTYSPRVDIAVGPFATEGRLISEYNELAKVSRDFIDLCLGNFRDNYSHFGRRFPEGERNIPHDYHSFADISYNRNARCFLAIEIEKSGRQKHMLGDIVNASALGRIGIILAWDDTVLRSFLRILEYFSFLHEVGKPTFNSRNVIILRKNQFRHILNSLVQT